MVSDQRGGWRLIGVTSFGDMECGSGTPGVYAWAAGPVLRPWLEAQIGADAGAPATHAISAHAVKRGHSRSRRRA
jgi:hypothetical protein